MIGKETTMTTVVDIIAWRVFKQPEPGHYQSAFFYSTFVPGVIYTALCAGRKGTFGSHYRSPVSFCACGFYAFKTEEQAHKLRASMAGGFVALVVKKVKLSGRIIEHEEVYRAEHMEILS